VKFIELPLAGAHAIEPEAVEDSRGFFVRTFCRDEFSRQGLNPEVVQCSTSFNRAKGTLRGMHYQVAPYEECKLVQCIAGSTFHVIIDLRDDSETRLGWTSLRLSAVGKKMLYVPAGFAHGFLTLEDNCKVHYQMSEFYHPESSAGVRWDDPAFDIDWPGDVVEISDRDRHYPDFEAGL
jgi:dTDP-4-dehydrorhamnose 3,5-epimerase